MTDSARRQPVAGLLFDSVSRNTGDKAIGIALHQAMSSLGIRPVDIAVHSDVPRPRSGLIVGGGELLRPEGDSFYDAFRVAGRHILNGVGVWPDSGGLDYLGQYAFVSVRTEADARVLQQAGLRDVEVVPCITTALHSEPVDIRGMLPVEQGEPLVGVHIVPHTMTVCPEVVDAVNALDGQKILVPFTHYNHDRSFMRSIGIRDALSLDELTPLQLHSVIGQLDLLVASSMHASIFAYSQGVPFVSVRQPKVEDYFGDRGLDGLLFGDRQELALALDAAAERPDFAHLVAADRTVLEQVLTRWREILELDDADPDDLPAGDNDPLWLAEIVESQLISVLEQRDALLGRVLDDKRQQETAAAFDLSQLRAELESTRFYRSRERAELIDLRPRYADATEKLDAIMSTRTMRALRIPRALYGRVRRLLGLAGSG